MAWKSFKIRKIIAWIIGVIFFLIIIVPCLLYIPVVQNAVKNIATSYINENTSMKMSIERIMLAFPFMLNVDDVLLTEESCDTMVYAEKALVRVKLLPLLKQKVEVQDVELNKCVYNMVSEDSTLAINARVNRFKLDNSTILLNKNEVNVGNILLNGGAVNINLSSSKESPAVEDSVNSLLWKINLERLKLENISYGMQMLPTIQDLDTKISSVIMNNCKVNLEESRVNIEFLGIDKADLKYIYPAIEDSISIITDKTTFNTDTLITSSEVQVWTINADMLRLGDSHVVYAMNGVVPAVGLDVNYFELSDINVGIDSLYNKGTDIKLSLTKLTARERCGLFVTSGSGFISMDSKTMKADDVKIETMQSKIILDGEVGTDFATDSEVPMNVDMQFKLGLGELGYMYPSMKPMLKDIPQYNPIEMSVEVNGSASKLNLREFMMKMPQHIALSASGKLNNILSPDELIADVDFNGDFKNLSFVKPIVMADSISRSQVDFPEMKLSGSMAYSSERANADMMLNLASGTVNLIGEWNGTDNSYDAKMRVDSFPVDSILPLMHIGVVSARANVKGKGYDIFDTKTELNTNLVIDEITYENKLYKDLNFKAQMDNGYLSADLYSPNTNCDVDMSLSCLMNKNYYEFGVEGNIKNVDLKAMRLSDTACKGKGKLVAYGTANIDKGEYEADLNLNNFDCTIGADRYKTPAIVMSVVSSQDSMALYAYEEDMFINFNTQVGLDTLLSRFAKCQEIVNYEVQNKYLDMDTLQRTLPPMACELRIGKNNIVQQALRANGVKVNSIGLDLMNDSTIYMNGAIMGVESGEMKLDTVSLYASQRNKYITYKVHVGNKPGTNDEFAQVTVRGGIRGSALGMLLEQQNIKGEQGFRIGMNALLSDTAVDVNFFPKQPVIGYRKWEVNDSNIISFNYINRNFDANLNLKSDSSYVALHTEQNRRRPELKDVIFNIGGVQISEWLKVSPFIPPMSGVLSADVKMNFDGKNILGGGITRLNNFKFNRKRVGDFDLKIGLELDPIKNYIRLISSFGVDGKTSIIAKGALNDTTSQNPYNITVNVDSFPLQIANPFIPGDMAKINGVMNGSMNVVGTFSEPIINGYVQCNGGEINMPLFGSRLTLSDTKIPINSSMVNFNAFRIFGSNNNAINVDGYVNMLPLDNPKIDLRLKGNNVEFVNSKQQRKMEVFGKGYANITTDIKGSMNDMNVNVDLSFLPATNLTYVMQTDVSAIATQTDEKMVNFVNLADTTEEETDSLDTHISTSSFKLNAKLNIQQGSKFNVYLSNSGNDRVAIEGSGILNYSQSSLGDMRLVGQYTLSDGYVKYTPPLLSEKLFEFSEGSYVSWTGDVLNPILNIKAIDTMKATVSQEGQDSKLINFLVSLDITNTLNNMNLAFDLSTNDDVTVQNELLSMSASQRSSQAINLLLYNTYTGLGTTASTSGNPLYSFLNSQINRWAANTIKGVDLTLGVNQYDKATGDDNTKSTTYSYKISKSLFNDRFKIVVGGNYNPGGDTEDNFANSLLNDISFVYMLNQSGTMSVKLFRHTGYESILEGEVTETGGAFVIKRKLSTLKNFFRFNPWKRFRRANSNTNKDTVIKLEDAPVQYKKTISDEKKQ